MYTGFENLIWMFILLGMLPLIAFLAIAVVFVVVVVRAMKGPQPPTGPDAIPNGSMPWQMVLAMLMTQDLRPGGTSGQPGPAELGARQSMIDARVDPTPRP